MPSRPASATAAGATSAVVVDRMVLAAARQGGMRQCLIAILAAKALPRQASFWTAPFVCRTMSDLLLGVELLVHQLQ